MPSIPRTDLIDCYIKNVEIYLEQSGETRFKGGVAEEIFITALAALSNYVEVEPNFLGIHKELYKKATKIIDRASIEMSPLLAQRYNTERQRVNTFKGRQISLYPNF